MKSIAFFNNKGGVGKTTLLTNVAAYMALHMEKNVLVVDADPQCNASQIMLSDQIIEKLYGEPKNDFTIYSVIHPLSIGKGYNDEISPREIENFGVDLVPGDPRLALKEDLLSTDWQAAISGQIRGLRTSFVFRDFLSRCEDYDYVLFDVGPSLGSINRSVLLACDFFLSPMSIDIFSLRAIENISISISEWRKRLESGLALAEQDALEDLGDFSDFQILFAGYVAQQYVQKTEQGTKRAVAAYDRIMKRIPSHIKKHFIEKFDQMSHEIDYNLGSVSNLYSLVPMSQTSRKPIFELKSRDGVRGGHFNRVKEAEETFGNVALRICENVDLLSGE